MSKDKVEAAKTRLYTGLNTVENNADKLTCVLADDPVINSFFTMF